MTDLILLISDDIFDKGQPYCDKRLRDHISHVLIDTMYFRVEAGTRGPMGLVDFRAISVMGLLSFMPAHNEELCNSILH